MDYPVETWRAVIDRAVEHSGLDRRALASAAGLDASFLSPARVRKKRFSMQTIVNVAAAAGWDRDRLVAEVERAEVERKMRAIEVKIPETTQGENQHVTREFQ